jgi:hypothetical protein
MELHDWEHNAIFVPIAATLQWGTHLAWAIEAWRTRHGVHVRRWLDAVAEVEALASLAAYRYRASGDPFPESSTARPPSRASGSGIHCCPRRR